MYDPIEPAELAHDARGTPCSPRYGDVYHSHHGALGQARHVFLGGNDLPQRWRGQARFTVLETGFGLGLNFLATWAAWREDPERSARLHFASVEKHPFRAPDLATLHRAWPELAPLSAELLARWPALVPGLHRLHLDHGRVTLDLVFGDAQKVLAGLAQHADALYLDGFSPERNPELWSARICHLLAALCAPGATLATWSVSGKLREALGHAGFEVRKAPGFASKRQMLAGVLGAHLSRKAAAAAPAGAPERHALIIGAGLAGSALIQRLAGRGWMLELIDAAPGPGEGASGNHAGVLRPLPSIDDNRLARLTRAGTLYALRHLEALRLAGQEVRWNASGVLHLARDRGHETRQQEIVAAQGPPQDYLRFVDAAEASRIAGWPLTLGGWWFPSSGWVMPPSLCAANIAAAGDALRCHYGRRMTALRREGDLWQVLDERGAVIAQAPVAVLANGVGIRAVEQAAALPVRSARGQVTHLPAQRGAAPEVVVCRLGYVSPEIDGQRSAGATFTVDDPEPDLRASDQAENLARLDYILPGFSQRLPAPELAGRVGFRPASPDRLPMIGALPENLRPSPGESLDAFPRHPGLFAISGFGARGLVWSALAGELLASQLEGEPLPLERDIVDALDPARFLVKPRRIPRRNDE